MRRLTIFTPTYNRFHTLPRLYQSLCEQDSFDFEWLVIDDGSTDDTESLFGEWSEDGGSFPIRYYKTNNRGKQRAINTALNLASGEFFFIVDSDDALAPDAVSFVIKSFADIKGNPSLIGISGVKGKFDGTPLCGDNKICEGDFVDASNLQRGIYGLSADMAEAFFTCVLKRYSFPVWEGEKFTPEAVVWDRMALDGYRIRWYNKVIYYCEYLEGGLTDSSWKLLRENPMGYAMLFGIKLEYVKGWRKRTQLVLNFLSCCILAGELSFIMKCPCKAEAFLLFPLGVLLAVRRKSQFIKYC